MPTSFLIVTPGAADANSYCSIAVADQYHLDRPPADKIWSEAVHPAKTQALLWATKLLDRLLPWTGTVVTETQALLWPRNGMYYRNGYSIPSDIIPIDLQHATAEYAHGLLAENLAETGADIDRLGLSAFSTGSISLTFKESAISKAIPDPVYYLLPSGWIIHSRGVVELLRA